MKDEIKEILSLLNSSSWSNEAKQIEDYITNLQKGYCELKVKCNNGECDCTNEEYEGMVQTNIKGSLLLEDYKSRNENAINETELGIQVLEDTKESYPMISCDVVINRYLKPILKSLGEDKQ